MHVIHDLLDVQLVDQRGRSIGRVDGLVMEVTGGRPPRIVAIEVGAGVTLARVHPWLGRLWDRLARRVGAEPGPVQVPVSAIRDVGVDVTLDITPETRASLLRLERWVRRHIVAHLPGGGR